MSSIFMQKKEEKRLKEIIVNVSEFTPTFA